MVDSWWQSARDSGEPLTVEGLKAAYNAHYAREREKAERAIDNYVRWRRDVWALLPERLKDHPLVQLADLHIALDLPMSPQMHERICSFLDRWVPTIGTDLAEGHGDSPNK